MALLDPLLGLNIASLLRSFVLYFSIFLFGVALLFYVTKRSKKPWLIDQIPGPMTIPILGNAYEVINLKPKDLFRKLVDFCDHSLPMIRFWLVNTPMVFLFKAASAEALLSNQKYIDKSNDYNFLHPWLGTGLLTATGKKWHSRRKLLTPVFHYKILEDFIETFNQQSEILVTKLEAKADGKPFNIFSDIALCTLDVIMETAMRRSINAQKHSESDYVKAIYKMGSLIQYRQSRPWFHPDVIYRLFGYERELQDCLKVLHNFSNGTIKKRRAEYAAMKKHPNITEKDETFTRKRLTFLDLLLEYSEKEHNLTDEDIREEVDTFMFEGQDTTAAAINWTIYLLGSHPQIQKRVHEELDGIFGGTERAITKDDLTKMKLLDCCIKEALRLFPSVPFLGRELQQDTKIDGFIIPSGTTVVVFTYQLHRDPSQFPDPEEFKPERFLIENSSKRHPYSYVPFSAGPRNCIGQKFAQIEEKLVLASLLRRYRVVSSTKREDLKLLGELVLRPEDGNFVELYSRN